MLSHPFEKTLGEGPYSYAFAFVIKKPSEANPTGNYHTLPQNIKRGSGTCSHCGMAIMNVFVVRIGNGDLYGVGSECIKKVGMAPQEMVKVDKEIKRHQKELRLERKKRNNETARKQLGEFIEKEKERLAHMPHPFYPGKTALEYAEFCLANSSADSIKKIMTYFEKDEPND